MGAQNKKGTGYTQHKNKCLRRKEQLGNSCPECGGKWVRDVPFYYDGKFFDCKVDRTSIADTATVRIAGKFCPRTRKWHENNESDDLPIAYVMKNDGSGKRRATVTELKSRHS